MEEKVNDDDWKKNGWMNEMSSNNNLDG